jgi:transcriptional regulator with XRE-family HTH domain
LDQELRRLGKSLTAFSADSGISRSRLSKLRTGRHAPSKRTLVRLAAAHLRVERYLRGDEGASADWSGNPAQLGGAEKAEEFQLRELDAELRADRDRRAMASFEYYKHLTRAIDCIAMRRGHASLSIPALSKTAVVRLATSEGSRPGEHFEHVYGLHCAWNAVACHADGRLPRAVARRTLERIGLMHRDDAGGSRTRRVQPRTATHLSLWDLTRVVVAAMYDSLAEPARGESARDGIARVLRDRELVEAVATYSHVLAFWALCEPHELRWLRIRARLREFPSWAVGRSPTSQQQR